MDVVMIHRRNYPDRFVMPDRIRIPVLSWIPAYAGIAAGVIIFGARYKLSAKEYLDFVSRVRPSAGNRSKSPKQKSKSKEVGNV
jgi:hypothetical protein